MVGKGLKPNHVIMHIFLVHFVKVHDLDEGLRMYNRCLEDGASPNDRVMGALLKLTVNSKEQNDHIWNYILDRQVENRNDRSNPAQPRLPIRGIHIHHRLMHLLKFRRYSEALQLFDLESRHIRSDYVALGVEFKRNSDYKKLEHVIMAMESDGYSRQSKDFGIMINTARNLHNTGKIESTIREANGRKVV